MARKKGRKRKRQNKLRWKVKKANKGRIPCYGK